MKNNLENAFRNSLQDYEAPYDPKAWEAVSSKLSAPSAVGGNSTSSILKWMIECVILGAVATGAFFLWDNHKNITTAETSVMPIESGDAKVTAPKETTPNSENEPGDDAIVSPLEAGQESIQETNVNERITSVRANNNVSQNNASQSDVNSKIIEEIDKEETTPTPKRTEITFKKYVPGTISTTMLCEGESVVIINDDRRGNVKFHADGAWVVLQPGKSYVTKPKSSMEISFVNDRDEVIESSYIKVHSSPSADFTFEANIFEDGLPVVICQSYGDYVSYNWTFDGKLVRNGAGVKHHFFDKGDYIVDLTVVDRNGCEHTTTRTVRINDKYNLMAVDAFKPNGSDSRNRTFMPYSLTERDVKFQLTIVDPIDNNVVFTSSDANNTWDGTDQKTGKMTPSNKSYLWKVQVFNPLPNERPIYAGTIVHN